VGVLANDHGCGSRARYLLQVPNVVTASCYRVCAYVHERAADPLHCVRAYSKPSGDLAHSLGALRLVQRGTGSFFLESGAIGGMPSRLPLASTDSFLNHRAFELSDRRGRPRSAAIDILDLWYPA
jgi:hypothetical protein